MAETGDDMGSRPEYEWLKTAGVALGEMIDLIGQARNSIRLETYIFSSDAVGLRFRDALLAARKRGVEVKVLIDALGSVGLSGRFWDSLKDEGGEVHWFNPLRGGRWSYRNHRKLLVVDREVAVVWGCNIGEEYDGDGITQGWRDLGLRIEGPLCSCLEVSFDAYFDAAEFSLRHRLRLRTTAKGRADDGGLLLTDSLTQRMRMRRLLLEDLREAREVRIMCAYFLPTRRLRREIKRVAKRGGRVQLILPARSDLLISQLATRRLYQSLLGAGVELYEYQPQILHAKVFILDDVVYVGSANLDVRSLKINHELLVRLRTSSVSSEVNGMFEEDLKRSVRIEPEVWKRSRTFWNKLRERWAYTVLARVDPYLARLQLPGGIQS